jgi:hypothetical protein
VDRPARKTILSEGKPPYVTRQKCTFFETWVPFRKVCENVSLSWQGKSLKLNFNVQSESSVFKVTQTTAIPTLKYLLIRVNNSRLFRDHNPT